MRTNKIDEVDFLNRARWSLKSCANHHVFDNFRPKKVVSKILKTILYVSHVVKIHCTKFHMNITSNNSQQCTNGHLETYGNIEIDGVDFFKHTRWSPNLCANHHVYWLKKPVLKNSKNILCIPHVMEIYRTKFRMNITSRKINSTNFL